MMDLSANVERFKGFAEDYDRFRPSPPDILAEILRGYAGVEVPSLVVDLGCGTGLSTRYWADKAGQVIGIDPSPDMLKQAQTATRFPNIHYQEGFSHQTGLPERCAQIVTVSQALHWMEPQPTFVEAARILQPGGVFAAYDVDWPPVTLNGEAEKAFLNFNPPIDKKFMEMGEAHVKRWDKHEHLKRILASGCFRFGREILLHSSDTGNAERLYGLVISQGSTQTLLKQGFSEKELGLDTLKGEFQRIMGDKLQTWYWCIRVRMGIV